jgi:hypothetical protein
VNTKISTEKDRKILADVKREMDRPRLTASVRNNWGAAAAPAAKELAAHAAKEEAAESGLIGESWRGKRGVYCLSEAR